MALIDSFTRADTASTLSGAGATVFWSAHSGTWGVNTNRAYRSASAGTTDNIASVNTVSADGDVFATIAVAIPAVHAAGVAFRVVDNSNYWRVVTDGANVYMQRYLAGVKTTPVNIARAVAAGDTLGVRMSGNSLSILHNGAVVAGSGITDSNHNTATRHGLAIGGANPCYLDDFNGPALATNDTDPNSSRLLKYSDTWKFVAPDPGGSWQTSEAFDDSAWASGAGGFGDSVTTYINTPWIGTTTIALRKLLGPGSYSGATITVGADDEATVYLNGTLIATKSAPASEQTFSIANSAWGNNNLLAVRADNSVGGAQQIYVWIEVPTGWTVGSIAF